MSDCKHEWEDNYDLEGEYCGTFCVKCHCSASDIVDELSQENKRLRARLQYIIDHPEECSTDGMKEDCEKELCCSACKAKWVLEAKKP